MIKGHTKDPDLSDIKEQMVAEAAYYLAEHRSFMGGDPEQDWLEAEEQIDRLLEEEDEEKAR